MYHYPKPPGAEQQYQLQMTAYHQRLLDQVLAPTECPIGSDAETCFRARYPVVIIENIPYTITRQEVIQFFGPDARLAAGWPVHIIMERSSGKTMECYVEFATDFDAEDAVRRIKNMHDVNQGPRMGSRYVDVSMSSQETLLKALFPRSRCINWETGRPVVVPDEDWPNGFVGFLTDEELFCIARHARDPNRSAFSAKVPQRAYESITSTVWKFPWYATHLYTVHARNKLFVTLKTMIEHLVQRLRGGQIVGLDTRVVTELLRAGLECPAFNPRMKYVLAEASEDQSILRRMHPVWLPWFPFDTLTWLRPNNPTALEFYGMLISKGRTVRIPDGLLRRYFGPEYQQPYGEWWFHWSDAVASVKFFSDAINEEKQVLQTLLTTGHQVMTPSRRDLRLAPFTFPRSAAAPASPRGLLPAPSPRRPPGPLGPPASHGPQSPRGRGNWRGASSRGHRRF